MDSEKLNNKLWCPKCAYKARISTWLELAHAKRRAAPDPMFLPVECARCGWITTIHEVNYKRR